jgi:retron-type reverse transcriptase
VAQTLLGQPVSRLTLEQAESLSLVERLTLVSSDELALAFLPSAATGSTWSKEHLEAQWKDYWHLRDQLNKFLRDLGNRRLAAANRFANSFEFDDRFEIGQFNLGGKALSAINNPVGRTRKDSYLNDKALALVGRIFDRKQHAPWLTNSRSELLSAVLNNQIDFTKIPRDDRAQFIKGWRRRQLSRLIVAGKFEWIPSLPEEPTSSEYLAILLNHDGKSGDTRNWLEKHAVKPRNLSKFCSLLRQSAAPQNFDLALDLLHSPGLEFELKLSLLRAGGVALNNAFWSLPQDNFLVVQEAMRGSRILGEVIKIYERFKAKKIGLEITEPLAKYLAYEINAAFDKPGSRSDKNYRVNLLHSKALAEFGPAFATQFCAHIATRNAARLVHLPIPSILEKALRDHFSEEEILLENARWDLKSLNPRRMVGALVSFPKLVAEVSPKSWRKPNPVEHIDACVLELIFTRPSGKRIRRLMRAYGEARFASAVVTVARILPKTSRLRGYLELVVALGPSMATKLALALATENFDLPAGSRLDNCYVVFQVPKDSGGYRTVSAPHDWLKSIQRQINRNLLSHLPAHKSVHGFMTGRSIVTNANPHVGKSVVVNCDVSACFPSVSWRLVRSVLTRDFGDQLSSAAIFILTDICTMNGALPTGAPTSPPLLNRVLLRSDEILDGYAAKRGVVYTRYADDLTFSGDENAIGMLGMARHVLGQVGLKLDSTKTGIFRRGRRQMVTGLTVNETVNVPRRLRRRMRSAVHAVEQGREASWEGRASGLESLEGRLSYLASVNPIEGRKLLTRLRAASDSIGSS